MTVYKYAAAAIFASSMAFAQEPEPGIEPEPVSIAEPALAAEPVSIPAVEPGVSPVKPVVSIGLAAAGLGAIIYGIVQNEKVVDSVNKRDCKCAIDARANRNIGYAIGTALLAGGITFYFVF